MSELFVLLCVCSWTNMYIAFDLGLIMNTFGGFFDLFAQEPWLIDRVFHLCICVALVPCC